MTKLQRRGRRRWTPETIKRPTENARRPLLRIAKRDGVPLWKAWGVRILAVVLALLVNAVFIYSVTGTDPLEVYSVMWQGSFKSFYSFFTTLRDTAMLLYIRRCANSRVQNALLEHRRGRGRC